MIESNFKIRIRYSDTDQMGYVYYGKYANFYEIARVELFRKLGFSVWFGRFSVCFFRCAFLVHTPKIFDFRWISMICRQMSRNFLCFYDEF